MTICRPTQNAEAVYRPLAAAYVPLSQTHVNTFVFIFRNSLVFLRNKQEIAQSEASRLDKSVIQSDRNSHWVTLRVGGSRLLLRTKSPLLDLAEHPRKAHGLRVLFNPIQTSDHENMLASDPSIIMH